jgi:hypothetical protein
MAEAMTKATNWPLTVGACVIGVAIKAAAMSMSGVLVHEVAKAVLGAKTQTADEAIDEGIRTAERQLAAKLPKQVDAMTTLVGMRYVPHVVTYTYLLNVEAGDLNEAALASRIQNNTCHDGKMKEMIHRGWAFEHVYNDAAEPYRRVAHYTVNRCP